MGKQVCFYMDATDGNDFFDFVRSNADVVILADVLPSSEATALPELPEPGTPGWFQLWLWDRSLSSKPKLDYVAEKKYYAVDSDRSDVIQLCRSYVSDGCLIRGRIWAQMGYWDLCQSPPLRVEKSDSFRKWFNRLGAWIKRKGRRNELGEYVLPGAAAYEAGGGRLCQLNLDPNVKLIWH